MIVTSRPSLRTQIHLSQVSTQSKLDTCGMATKHVDIPMLEEHSGVGVQEACKLPNGICSTIGAVKVVPTGHLALVLVAMHVQGNADHGLVNIAVTKAAISVTGAVLHLVVRL